MRASACRAPANRWTVGLAAIAGLLAAGAARAEEAPREGDLANGARLFRLHCAECHGLDARGDGPLAAGLETRPANLRDGARLWSRTDTGLLAVIQEGGAAQGVSAQMPAHGRTLTQLEQRDVVTWLKAGVPSLSQFFPLASDFIAHEHEIDQYGRERAEKVLGRPLTTEEQRLLVFTLFRVPDGQAVPAEGPRRIPEEPAALYAARPKRKLGFVAYVPLRLDGAELLAGIALDAGMRLTHVRTVASADPKTEKLRQKLEPVFQSYVGSGGRAEKIPVAPQVKGITAPRDVQREMLRVFTVVLEAAAMYEKEERERFWAEPDAFKGLELAAPEDVKFEIKNRRAP